MAQSYKQDKNTRVTSARKLLTDARFEASDIETAFNGGTPNPKTNRVAYLDAMLNEFDNYFAQYGDDWPNDNTMTSDELISRFGVYYTVAQKIIAAAPND